jgi:dihydroxyacetone kinase
VNGAELRAALLAALPRLATSTDELRDLDAAIGDGDLGITVAEGSAAAIVALRELPDTATPGEVLRSMGPAVARANPSTFAALVASALLAGAKAIADRDTVTRDELIEAGRIGAQAIATRGKSGVGDKTVLDALIPSLDAAGATADDPLGAAVQAARAGVEATRDLVSVRGRAAWVGERTRGHADPGAMAYLRLLEAFASSSTEAPA